MSNPRTMKYLAGCMDKTFGDTHKRHNDPNQPEKDGEWSSQNSLKLGILRELAETKNDKSRLDHILSGYHGHMDLALRLFGYYSSPENGGGTQRETPLMDGPYKALLRVMTEQRMGYDNLMKILKEGIYPLQPKMEFDEQNMLFEVKNSLLEFLTENRILLGQWLAVKEMNACLDEQKSIYDEITSSIGVMHNELKAFAAEIGMEIEDPDEEDDDEEGAEEGDEEGAEEGAEEAGEQDEHDIRGMAENTGENALRRCNAMRPETAEMEERPSKKLRVED